MTPLQRYRSDIDRGRIMPDPAQSRVVDRIQALYDDLTAETSGNPLKQVLSLFSGRRRQSVTGIYLWGSVGSGKTYIADMLYDCLPVEDKLRVHFHRYMQWVHAELKQLADVEAPLGLVADKLARDTTVICFDEFHVSDITDAMLLGGLLRELFRRGVILVATSNEHPDRLYWGGLQRERFLPAIELIKRHNTVVSLDTAVDYRLRYLDQARTYHHPLDAGSHEGLAQSFAKMTSETAEADTGIEIEGRELKVKRLASGVVWFDFTELCDGPRGVADYIEIARQFQTVFVEGIPQLEDMDNDRAKRFIVMVDEFYDRNVKLIVSAQAPAQELYTGKRLAREFRRTASRLTEMQSHDYLGRPHLPD